MRHLILTISITGVIIHLILLAILIFKTSFVIGKTSEFIRYEINRNLNKEINKIRTKKTFKTFKLLLSNHIDNIDLKVDSVEANIKYEISKLIEELKVNSGKIENPSIEPFEITRVFNDKTYMHKWLRFRCLKILKDLKLELCIFLTTNLLVFLILVIANFKKERPEIVKLLSIISIISVILSSLMYIFAQNWFYALILNAYFGFSYSLIILFIIGIFADVTFNKGKILAIIGLPQI